MTMRSWATRAPAPRNSDANHSPVVTCSVTEGIRNVLSPDARAANGRIWSAVKRFAVAPPAISCSSWRATVAPMCSGGPSGIKRPGEEASVHDPTVTPSSVPPTRSRTASTARTCCGRKPGCGRRARAFHIFTGESRVGHGLAHDAATATAAVQRPVNADHVPRTSRIGRGALDRTCLGPGPPRVIATSVLTSAWIGQGELATAGPRGLPPLHRVSARCGAWTRDRMGRRSTVHSAFRPRGADGEHVGARRRPRVRHRRPPLRLPGSARVVARAAGAAAGGDRRAFRRAASGTAAGRLLRRLESQHGPGEVRRAAVPVPIRSGGEHIRRGRAPGCPGDHRGGPPADRSTRCSISSRKTSAHCCARRPEAGRRAGLEL